MTQEIRDKIASLASQLGETVFYNMDIHSSISESRFEIVESHRLYVSGYETIRRATLNQIMSVIAKDFIPEKQQQES